MPKTVTERRGGAGSFKAIVGRTTRREQNETDDPDNDDGWTYPNTRSDPAKSYAPNMLQFMTWFHRGDNRYPNDTTFTRAQLLEIKPVDVHDWLAIMCFGIADYVIGEHKPTGARSTTLLVKKKSVSYFMPNQKPQWCNNQGNPTKSAIVNKLIATVKLCETRREGAPSHVKRPLTSQEFLLMSRKLQSHSDWTMSIKYRTMNLYQFHLIGRADDTCHFEMRDPRGHTVYPFALQTRVRWSKNVRDERTCPDQIILGANDPRWCVLIHLAVYLESFLEIHPDAYYLFTESMNQETGPNNLKSAWSDKLRRFIWADAEFKDLEQGLSDDGGVGTHSNRKLGATSAALYGCATLEIEIRGRWKVSKGKQVQVYIDVKRAYEDAKVCAALCGNAPVKYALKEGLTEVITHKWLCENVIPNVTRRFWRDAGLCNVLGLVLLHACTSDSPDIAVPNLMRQQVRTAYNELDLDETVPVAKIPLCIHREGDQLVIDEINENDLMILGGGGGGGEGGSGGGGEGGGGGGGRGATLTSRGSVHQMLQAVVIRTSRMEQSIQSLQLSHQASQAETRNFMDSRFKVMNNNIRATGGTIAGGFAIQNNGGRIRTLNDLAAPLLNQVIQPARLSPAPRSIKQLWQEYMVGLNGNKPAHLFTPNERNSSRDVKQKYYRRNKVWELMDRLIRSGLSADAAIARIHGAYGSNITMTVLIAGIIKNPSHPNL